MNILEIIKKAPEDHVYWCALFGNCNCNYSGSDNDKYPIRCDILSESGGITLSLPITKDGKYVDDTPYAECVLFPSYDNRDWKAFERELMGITEGRQYVLRRAFGEEELPLSTEIEFEGGGQAVFDRFCGISGINLDHEYYKNHPYINFQIDGKEYKVSIKDMKRLAMGNAYNKAEHISCQSFDGTAEMVSIPDRPSPMMAAVIMSGMLACGGMEHNDPTLVNRAVRLANMILDETETKTKEE